MQEYYIKNINAYMRYQELPGRELPILFIHGLGCAGSFDYPQVAAWQELASHPRILLDLLGAGYSDKPEDFPYSVSAHAEYLKEFVDSLGLKEFILFGHSLGGPIAMELASLCGSRVRHLILSESNLDPSKPGDSSYSIARLSEKYFVEKGCRRMIEECRKKGNTMWAATLSNWLPLAAYRLSKSGAEGGTPSWRTLLYELPVHKSFLFGERSLPDPDYEELKQHGIQVETVPEAGHSMAWENPRGLAEAISRCLASAEYLYGDQK